MSPPASSLAKLQANQIQVGKPLPFDAYDAGGHLLLRRGFVIDTRDQLLRLLEEGLFREGGADALIGGLDREHGIVPAGGQRHKGHNVCVFDLVDGLRADLQALLQEAQPANLPDRVTALATQLQRAYRLDSDATIATVQLLTEGRYAIRRMVHGAILIEMLLSETAVKTEVRRVVLCAALTMNISMLDLQDELYVQKEPPSEAQREQVQRHPAQGQERLVALGVTDQSWLRIVAQHHETIDGAGYPQGLKGQDITRAAQLLSLADRYGAMATGRAYRAPALPSAVLKRIFMERGKGIDESLVALLIKAVGVYPPGSLVELANGDLAIVVKRTQNAKQPVVRSVRNYRKQILESPRKRLTSEPQYAITRILALGDLGFDVNPKTLWDDAFEFDEVPPPAPESP